ncbi:HAMP domain-containing histidine kinase [Sphingomonas sp. QA11]|uniref:sensor histidine kinase n=1 Tax=Sphingomonas sp. QA11 TaxID=2950605 RepID=UPI002349C311|nr:HAMP domain-containing sensor histidine kinase [Sphingomonas sp. QA11]WCM28631.1 HAMP domain-containing histidine kinase [Sphingomonas sp. QA11]
MANTAVRFFASLAGRLVIILTIGMSAAAISSLAVAERVRQHEFERFRAERIALSAEDVLRRLDSAPAQTSSLLSNGGIIGAHSYKGKTGGSQPIDRALETALRKRLPQGRDATGFKARFEECFGPFTKDLEAKFSQRAAGFVPLLPECWVVKARNPEGGPFTLIAFDLPALGVQRSATLNPVYLLLIIVAAAILSIIVARLALASLDKLTLAAHAFSDDIDAEPIAETGPTDVRDAFVAFNIMQRRVREGVRERTRILAAISHDLQTPLTRMRLRLEQIDDIALRERLITDLAMMLRLVREGLTLARSSESNEEWAMLDLNSLIESLVDEAVQDGHDVTSRECQLVIRSKPDALARVLQNLLDNAVRYAGRARIIAISTESGVTIEIHDDGPGIPGTDLERMFEPFVRGEASRSRSTGGTGIGLTIARAQAKTFGGRVFLANAPGGGLIATLALPRPSLNAA